MVFFIILYRRFYFSKTTQTNYAEFLLNGSARISTTVYKRDKHDAYRLSAKLSQVRSSLILVGTFPRASDTRSRGPGFETRTREPGSGVASHLTSRIRRDVRFWIIETLKLTIFARF